MTINTINHEITSVGKIHETETYVATKILSSVSLSLSSSFSSFLHLFKAVFDKRDSIASKRKKNYNNKKE